MKLGFSPIFGIFSAENWENSPVFSIGKGADYRPQIGPRKIPEFCNAGWLKLPRVFNQGLYLSIYLSSVTSNGGGGHGMGFDKPSVEGAS